MADTVSFKSKLRAPLNIRDQFLQHVGNTILNINEKNEIDKIKMFMSKEFVDYFAKIISDMIEVRHEKLFVKT